MNSFDSFDSFNSGRRWMLVDDNRDMLSVLSVVLAKLTCAKIECHDSPQAAFAAYAAAPDSYELVITDYEMPGMDGCELCSRLRAISPALKIFLATGSGFFTEAAARHHGFMALLSKPFPVTTLRAALASAGLPEETVCAA